jgi:hypothetical protein
MLRFRDAARRHISPEAIRAWSILGRSTDFAKIGTVSYTPLSQLNELERIIDAGGPHVAARVVGDVTFQDQRFPLHVVTLGSADPAAPAIGFFGGVHGLERIGAEVVISYLDGLVNRLRWDDTVHRQLESIRLVFMPVVNPGGIWRGTRANPNGIDLMRNAPVDAVEKVPFLVGGQRISARLPWFRGAHAAEMEVESRAVCQVVHEELLARPFSIAVDCHSGFGMHDRVWFPYAHTSKPIGHLAEVHALKDIFMESLNNHRYIFEPQSRQYLAHGDLWDHLYLQAAARAEHVFLPFTLEMGSWVWVKKNPRQLFSRHGIFNPLIEHRQQRVLRRHVPLLDFFARAAASHRLWMPCDAARVMHHDCAMNDWYPGRGGRPRGDEPQTRA